MKFYDYLDKVQLKQVGLDTIHWNLISGYVESLKHLHFLTIRLQKSNICFGDFFIYWRMATMELDVLNNKFSRLVTVKMKERRENLLANDIMIACLFIDPRLNFCGVDFLDIKKRTQAKVI